MLQHPSLLQALTDAELEHQIRFSPNDLPKVAEILHDVTQSGSLLVLDLLLRNKRVSNTSEYINYYVQTKNGFESNLNVAAQCGRTAFLRRMIQEGADPNCLSNRGYTALIHASSTGNVDNVAMLLEAGADANLFFTFRLHQLTALGVSASQGERDGSRQIVKTLLEHGAYVRITTKAEAAALPLLKEWNILDLIEPWSTER